MINIFKTIITIIIIILIVIYGNMHTLVDTDSFEKFGLLMIICFLLGALHD